MRNRLIIGFALVLVGVCGSIIVLASIMYPMAAAAVVCGIVAHRLIRDVLS